MHVIGNASSSCMTVSRKLQSRQICYICYKISCLVLQSLSPSWYTYTECLRFIILSFIFI